MKKKKRILLSLCGIALLLFSCIVISNYRALSSSFTRFLFTESPVLSSNSFTPGLSNQKTCSYDYSLPTVVHSDADFSFYYETSEYSYGITSDGYEVISFINPDGTAVEALKGGGTFLIYNTYAYALTRSEQHIKNYEQTTSDSLTVYYDTNGSEQFTHYVFNSDNIEITANVTFPKTVSKVCFIELERDFINGYIDSENKVTSDWIFPNNGDFPYKTFDSYVLTNYIDSTHKLYSFWREPDANPVMPPDYYPDNNLKVSQVPTSLSTYSLSYTLVFENLTQDTDYDYYALFKGKNSELAIGITPTNTLESNATLFNSKDISFNINLTNLSDTDVSYNIDYCIYDYYGDIYTNTRDSRTVSADSQVNYLLNPSIELNGIYYLDALVSYNGKEYHELYPFIVYNHHDYQYTSSSPFGVSGVRFGVYAPNDDTVFLANEMGIANMRVCISLPDYVSSDYTLLQDYLFRLYANGTNITGQYLLSSDWTIPDDTTRYASELDNILSYIGSALTSCEIGNENNLKYVNGDIYAGMANYLEQQFNPTFPVVTQNYQLPIISAGVYLCQTDWLEASVMAGLWNNTDILSTHAYSFPHSPDFVNDPSIDHSYESALARIRNFMDTYGEKTWHMSEFGYPTTPGKSSGLFSGSDLRSQADYTIREYILGLSYGVDVLMSYSFYDGVNTTKAMNDDNLEYHYGMFYGADYYGRIMPKPLASAYMTMTQELDGYLSCSEVKDTSSTSRIFEITLQQSDSPIYIGWSNCKPLTTDTLFSRTPGLPWENQWTSSEDITFYTDTYVTVTDFQGNSTIYYPKKGIVSIPITGEPVIINNASFEPANNTTK